MKISRCSAVTACKMRALTSRSASPTAWPSRARDQRGQLEQLEVADDRVRDVEVGVEPQLAEAPARPQRALEHLVAQQPVGRVQGLGRAEQLLALLLPLLRGRDSRPPR